MPAKSAASVEAVSGGASITRPPCGVRCTVSPAKSFWTSLADGRVPRKLDVDARAGRALEVEAHAAGVGGEEDAARGVVVELDDVLGPALLAFLPREERGADVVAREHVARGPVREPQHSAP